MYNKNLENEGVTIMEKILQRQNGASILFILIVVIIFMFLGAAIIAVLVHIDFLTGNSEETEIVNELDYEEVEDAENLQEMNWLLEEEQQDESTEEEEIATEGEVIWREIGFEGEE